MSEVNKIDLEYDPGVDNKTQSEDSAEEFYDSPYYISNYDHSTQCHDPIAAFVTPVIDLGVEGARLRALSQVPSPSNSHLSLSTREWNTVIALNLGKEFLNSIQIKEDEFRVCATALYMDSLYHPELYSERVRDVTIIDPTPINSQYFNSEYFDMLPDQIVTRVKQGCSYALRQHKLDNRWTPAEQAVINVLMQYRLVLRPIKNTLGHFIRQIIREYLSEVKNHA